MDKLILFISDTKETGNKISLTLGFQLLLLLVLLFCFVWLLYTKTAFIIVDPIQKWCINRLTNRMVSQYGSKEIRRWDWEELTWTVNLLFNTNRGLFFKLFKRHYSTFTWWI